MERSLSDAAAFVVGCVRALGLKAEASRLSQFYDVLHNLDGTSKGMIEPGDPGFQIACEALRDLTQLEFVFDQADLASESQEIRPKVKLVVKDPALPQHGSPESLGRDAQTELFVFGACRKAGLNPSFQEPDMVCILDDQPLALAVKRVKNMRQLVKRIKEGARQITRAGDYGIIFVDVVIAMNPKNHRVIARVPDAAFGLTWGELLRRLVDKHYTGIQRAIHNQRVLGVILHDHWVRMDSRDHWRLETMTYTVPAQGVDPSLAHRLATFTDKYISALPNLTKITT
jgi:hypothetical protein